MTDVAHEVRPVRGRDEERDARPVDGRYLARRGGVAGAADDAGDVVVHERARRTRTCPRRARVVEHLELDVSAENAAVLVDLRRRELGAGDEIAARARLAGRREHPDRQLSLAAVAEERPSEQRGTGRDDHGARPRGAPGLSSRRSSAKR